MNRKFFLILEQILVVSILQYIFYNFFNFKIVPSFYLIYLLLLSFNGEVEVSIFLSFLLGIINDLFTKELLGATSIRYLLLVYFSSFFVVKSTISKSSLIFLFSFLYFILLIFKKEGQLMWNSWVLLKYAFLFSFYNFLIGIFVEIFVKEISRRWEERFF
ncbi:MAG: hypothetical protein NC833_05405 [Candidatus Omnitrophica bacterium]|nr:hypothetical protein [Candidatus Omnitrophota bacterium]